MNEGVVSKETVVLLCNKQMNEGVVSKETVVLRRWGSSIPLILTVLTNAFHLTNIFLFFTLPCYHQ